MHRFRNGVTVVCFVVFTIVASLAALQTIRAGLPETPSSTGAAMLIAHLGENQLAEEEAPAKRHWARRVMRELNDDVDWQPDVAALSAPQKQQFLDNLLELAQDLLEQKMRSFHAQPNEREQRRFISRQIEEIMRWAMLLDRATRAPGEDAVQLTALANMMTRLNKWYSEAGPEERSQMQAFQKAFQEQLTDRFRRNMRQRTMN